MASSSKRSFLQLDDLIRIKESVDRGDSLDPTRYFEIVRASGHEVKHRGIEGWRGIGGMRGRTNVEGQDLRIPAFPLERLCDVPPNVYPRVRHERAD